MNIQYINWVIGLNDDEIGFKGVNKGSKYKIIIDSNKAITPPSL